MSGSATDQPMGPLAPIADYTGKARMRDTLGHKNDVAASGSTASTMALLRHIVALLIGLDIDLAYRISTELPEWVVTGDMAAFSIGITNTSTGNPIPSGDITAGTVDVIRIRGGGETVIHAGYSLLVLDGVLYCEIDTNTVNWQKDDQIKVVQATQSYFDIGIDTYYISFGPQLCHLVDMGTVGTQIDSIEADTNEIQLELANGGRLDLIFDDILADTNELQTDWTSGGRLDLILDGIATDVSSALADLTSIEGKVDVIDSVVDNIATIVGDVITDTNELQTDWTDGGRLDLILDSIEAGMSTVDWSDITDILADTNELQTDWVDGGRLDLILDSILSYASDTVTIISYCSDILNDTDELQTDWTDGGRLDLIIDAILADTATIDWTDVTDILADTDELQTDWTDGGRLDLILDDILATLDAIDPVVAIRPIGVLDFWAQSDPNLTIPGAPANVAFNYKVPLPSYFDELEIIAVYALLNIRVMRETSGAVNCLAGVQTMEVRIDTPGSWTTAMNFSNNFSLQANQINTGTLYIGNVDIKSTVNTGNDSYEAQFPNISALGAAIILYDVQWGLRVVFQNDGYSSY
jgi:hypothetical protein